jgi:HEAT repeat protein
MTAVVVFLMVTRITPDPVRAVPVLLTNQADALLQGIPGIETANISQKNDEEKIESDQTPERTIVAIDSVNEEDNGQELPEFFPLTPELEELIRLAEHALRMDLPDEEKLAALAGLEGINNPAVLEVVDAALLEGNAEVREAALDAIMDINDPVVIPTVVKALDDEDPELREYALDALMDIDDPALNEAFSKALDDENLDVRAAAVDMMLFIESPAIIDSLGKAMLDPNQDIRDMALMAIEDIPDKRSVDILIQIGLLDDNDSIREDALDSIEWMTDMEFANYEGAREWWDANRGTFTFDD